jgi:hypothetical protein
VLLSGSYLPKAVPRVVSVPPEGREEGIPFPLMLFLDADRGLV